VFAPPFHFCRGIATEPANSLADPPSPRTRVGQKGRLLPHEAPFSFSGRPPPGISRKVFSLASGSTAYPGCCPGQSTAMPRLGRRAGPLRHQFPGRFPRRHHSRSRTAALAMAADYHRLGANMRTQTPPSRHWPASIAYLQLFTTVGQLYLAGPTPGLNAIALRLTRRRASHHQGCTPRNLGRTPDRGSPPIGLSCPHNQ